MSIMKQVDSKLHFKFHNYPTGIQINTHNAIALISMESTYPMIHIDAKTLKKLHHIINHADKHLSINTDLRVLVADTKTRLRRAHNETELASLRPVYDAKCNELYRHMLQKL